MAYKDLREFMAQLEAGGQLQRVAQAVSPRLEMTAVCDRVLRRQGPALLFEQVSGHSMPVLGNLFGTTQRVAQAMGMADVQGLRSLGQVLAMLKAPPAPAGMRDVLGMSGLLKKLWHMSPSPGARGAGRRSRPWTCP